MLIKNILIEYNNNKIKILISDSKMGVNNKEKMISELLNHIITEILENKKINNIIKEVNND